MNRIWKDRLRKTAVLVFVVVPIVSVVVAMYLLWQQYVFWTDIALFFGLYLLTGLGVTIGYHRMLTHQSFEAPDWFRGFLMICGCMAFQMQPITWAADHIKHHAHSDEEGDPHSPLEGFWHAHFGWLFQIEEEFDNDPAVYVPHLLQDPVTMFVSKYYMVWMGLSLAIPYALGGPTGFLWGGLVRIFMVSHATWSVNSICHCFGNRSFETTDESHNNWIIGLLAFGEGWHNNHHAFPQNAYHGMRWWQFDLSGILIRGFEKAGLVWNVRSVTIEAEKSHKERIAKMKEVAAELKSELLDAILKAKGDVDALRDTLPSVPKPSLHEFKKRYGASRKRLDYIHKHMTSVALVKRQKMQEYLEEVKAVSLDTKAAMARARKGRQGA